MVIHAKNRPEKKYHLNKYDEEQIIEIWAWLKKKEIYTSEFPEELDVAIWLDTDAMESFFEYFGNEEYSNRRKPQWLRCMDGTKILQPQWSGGCST